MAIDKPDDEFLDDLNLDDVDFDSLLDEDTKPPVDGERVEKSGEPAADAAPGTETDETETDETVLDGLVFDDDGDEDIDFSSLLSGDESDASLDETLPETGSGDDEIEELGAEDLLDDTDAGAIDFGAGADDDDGGADIAALLADDDDDAAPAGDDDTVLGDEAFLDAGDAAVAGAGAAAAMSAGASADDEDSSWKGGKGAPRKKFGGKIATKGAGSATKIGSAKKVGATKKAAGARASKEKKARTPAPVVSSKGALRFICSECYSEFHLPASFQSEALTCPECLHVGKRPDERFLSTVQMHKAGERKSFTAALVVGAMAFAAFVFLVWLVSPYCTLAVATRADDLQTWTFGLLGGGGLLSIIFVWLMARFESNRWEVYF